MTDDKLQVITVVQKQQYYNDTVQRYDDIAYDAITRKYPDAVFSHMSIQTEGVIEDSEGFIKYVLSDETGLIALNYYYTSPTQGETK